MRRDVLSGWGVGRKFCEKVGVTLMNEDHRFNFFNYYLFILSESCLNIQMWQITELHVTPDSSSRTHRLQKITLFPDRNVIFSDLPLQTFCGMGVHPIVGADQYAIVMLSVFPLQNFTIWYSANMGQFRRPITH